MCQGQVSSLIGGWLFKDKACCPVSDLLPFAAIVILSLQASWLPPLASSFDMPHPQGGLCHTELPPVSDTTPAEEALLALSSVNASRKSMLRTVLKV